MPEGILLADHPLLEKKSSGNFYADRVRGKA
ncbi:hypothetical protein X474_05025 [Dethiosulfatarculus sandiegensis]|uniref:Uncharacterized protein n=1 Tax=Dethiosulfatarculus sandiegensis TaxID=1429043 RepID=A0A0D2HY27_9BACT|nr:hypothetical protein X474_05025 [Dethiosulfatarculus sandiegensis]